MDIKNDIDVKITGKIVAFQFKAYDEQLHSSVKGFYNNEEVDVYYKYHKVKPSSSTHNYYRGVLLPCFLRDNQFAGWSIIDLHSFFTREFLTDVKERNFNGKSILIPYVQSTGDLSQKEMNSFIERVKQFASENNIEIIEPLKQPKK